MKSKLDTTIRQIKDYLEISTRYHTDGIFVANHWHDYYEFEIVIEGEYEHVVNGEERIAKRGSAWIMSQLDYHSLKCTKDAIILNISFTGQNIEKDILSVLSSSTDGFLCDFDDDETSKILLNAQKARTEILEKPLLWECNAKSLVQSILIKIIRQSSNYPIVTGKKTPRLLQNVISYIHNNYSADLSVNALAYKFNVSPGHLGLVFSKTFGTSLSSYVTRVRLKRACNLLENSELSTKEIAYTCGFSSVEYFYYVFKEQLQTTPGDYRKNTEGQAKNYSVISQTPEKQ